MVHILTNDSLFFVIFYYKVTKLSQGSKSFIVMPGDIFKIIKFIIKSGKTKKIVSASL